MITIFVQGKAIHALCDAHPNYCTVNHRYATGKAPPNYPMPAIPTPTHLVALLWQAPMPRYQERKVRKWFLALCFDARGYFKG